MTKVMQGAIITYLIVSYILLLINQQAVRID